MNDLMHFLTNPNINPSDLKRLAHHAVIMQGEPNADDGLQLQDLTAVMGTCCFTDPGPDPDPDPDPEPPPSDATQ